MVTQGATKKDAFIWAAFQPFGRNMWSDVPVKKWASIPNGTADELLEVCAADHLRFDEAVWRRVADRMVARGLNTVVLDVGEALAYPSHPELHVKGSWAPERVLAEVRRLKAMGLEVVPKLNFSACHDTWLKEYHRMLSTPEYYKVCADVLKDAYEAFGKPRLFHIGFDEETSQHQAQYGMAIVRQGDLWWHDFLYIEGIVEKLGARPWIWSDRCWFHKEEFLQRMPKSVLQSNWYYGRRFLESPHERSRIYAQTYIDLDKSGFDQVPCGSTIGADDNFQLTVDFVREHVSAERLKGFLMAAWGGAMLPQNEAKHLKAMDIAGGVRASFLKNPVSG